MYIQISIPQQNCVHAHAWFNCQAFSFTLLQTSALFCIQSSIFFNGAWIILLLFATCWTYKQPSHDNQIPSQSSPNSPYSLHCFVELITFTHCAFALATSCEQPPHTNVVLSYWTSSSIFLSTPFHSLHCFQVSTKPSTSSMGMHTLLLLAFWNLSDDW